MLQPRDEFYASALPAAAKVLLIVEVADTSQETDRSTKLPLYARGGIPEAWLVDIEQRVVEVGHGPGPEGDSERHILRTGETIRPAAFGDVELPVDQILP